MLDYASTVIFFFSSRRRHTRFSRDWSSDVCSSDLVEATGAQKRLIENFRPVGGGEDDQPHRAVEAVHLGEQLVERLLTLVVAADGAADAARAAQRIELVDEDDGRRLPAGLLEQVAHTGRTHADEHLDKL